MGRVESMKDVIKPEIREAYRIFKLEKKYNTKQNYKKAFKNANTRKTYNRYKSLITGGYH